MACHGRSKEFYASVALEWVLSLLDMANKENKKIVFMARDGQAPYRLAKKLLEKDEFKQKYPNMGGDDKIVLGYFSRKVINSSYSSNEKKQLFQDYLQKPHCVKEFLFSYFYYLHQLYT